MMEGWWAIFALHRSIRCSSSSGGDGERALQAMRSRARAGEHLRWGPAREGGETIAPIPIGIGFAVSLSVLKVVSAQFH